jgi:hypothetical protein
VQGLRKEDVMTEQIGLNERVMAEEIRVIEHYSALILNKVREGARVLGGTAQRRRKCLLADDTAGE